MLKESMLNERGQRFELIHNHPNSSMPSTDDIKGLFNRKYAHATTIVCHDGSLYRLVKLKQFNEIDNLIDDVYNSIEKSEYSGSESNFEYMATTQAIDYLLEKKFITFEAR